MRNEQRWRPGKYERRGARLRASRDASQVAVGSRLMADRVARFYESELPRHARGALLDLGCGSAPLYGAYRPLVTEIVCADWPAGAQGSEHVDLHCDLGAPLPLASEAIDTIILSDVLEHVPEPAALWAEMARVLRPGGKLLLNVPFCYAVHERPHDYYRYTEFALRRFARESGLELLSLEPLGGSAEVLADLLAKHLQFVPLLGTVLAALVQGMAALLGATGPGARLARHTAEAYPYGYALVAQKPRGASQPPGL